MYFIVALLRDPAIQGLALPPLLTITCPLIACQILSKVRPSDGKKQEKREKGSSGFGFGVPIFTLLKKI